MKKRSASIRGRGRVLVTRGRGRLGSTGDTSGDTTASGGDPTPPVEVGFFQPDVTPVSEVWGGDLPMEEVSYGPKGGSLTSLGESQESGSVTSKPEKTDENPLVSTTGNCPTPILDEEKLSPRDLAAELKQLPADCNCQSDEEYPGHEGALAGIQRPDIYQNYLSAVKLSNRKSSIVATEEGEAQSASEYTDLFFDPKFRPDYFRDYKGRYKPICWKTKRLRRAAWTYEYRKRVLELANDPANAGNQEVLKVLAHVQGETVYDAGTKDGYRLDWCLNELVDMQVDSLEDAEDREFLRGVLQGLLLATGIHDGKTGRCSLEHLLMRARGLLQTPVVDADFTLSDIADSEDEDQREKPPNSESRKILGEPMSSDNDN